MNLHYTMSGSDSEGWRLGVYKYAPYPFGTGDTIVFYQDPVVFDTLEDMLDKLGELRSLEDGL